MITPSEEKLLTIDQVIELTGLSRASVYTEMRERGLPRPVRVGHKSVRWRLSQLVVWMDSLETVTGDVGGSR